MHKNVTHLNQFGCMKGKRKMENFQYTVFNEDEIQNYFSLTNLFEENHVSLFEHDFNFYLITMINHSC